MKRNRAVRLLTWGLGGVLLGVALAVLVLNIVARTKTGQEFVLQRTLQALGKNLNGGQLNVVRIDGNLFEGAKLYGISLKDRQGRAFVLADSAYLDYDVKTLISPRIHITRATLYEPEVYVFKLPGDSLWNYQAIFAADPNRSDSTKRVERVTLLDTLRMIDGVVRVQNVWKPDSTLSARAQQAEIAAALSDTSVVLVNRVGGGYIRTMNFRRMNGRLSRVRFAPGTVSGSRIHIDSMRTEAQIFRQPVQLHHGQGTIALLKGYIEFDVPIVRLRNSLLATSGVVRTDSFPRWFNPAEAPMYDVAFRTDSVDFGDLRWLYKRFPEDASGKLSLRIESRPGGTMFLARNADVRAPGTHVVGSFGMQVGDTLRFMDVDLKAEPVRVSTIERMLPEGLPVRGLHLGGADIRGAP
jgi:hypothetical protein